MQHRQALLEGPWIHGERVRTQRIEYIWQGDGALDSLTTHLEISGIKQQKKQPIMQRPCRGERQSLISCMGYNKGQRG